jgi:hypothetical protein
MLPPILTKNSTLYKEDSNWEQFLIKIGEYADLIENDFLSQICFEHSARFNEYFPFFDIHQNKIIRVQKTTQEIYTQIRYDDDKKLDFWYFQIDDYLKLNIRKQYKVLKYVVDNGTWHFPPVIIENKIAKELGNKNYGNLIHLIEGTHRVSFVNRLYELGKIDPDRKHNLLEIV